MKKLAVSFYLTSVFCLSACVTAPKEELEYEICDTLDCGDDVEIIVE